MFRHALAFAVLLSSLVQIPVFAAEVPVLGDRARFSDLPKTPQSNVTSYDARIDAITLNPTVSGATLDLYSPTTGQQLTIDLPAANWKGPLPNHRYRYVARGNPTIKILMVHGRMLKISLKGTGSYDLNGVPQGTLAIRLSIGSTRYCTVFGGTITRDDGLRFIARKAPAPASCPIAPNDLCAGVVCTALDSCHDVGVCDPGTGLCSNPVKPDNTSCDADGTACTQNDTCQAGSCTAGAPVTCSPIDACHVSGTCNPATGTCSVGAEISCNDGNVCTADSCDPVSGCQNPLPGCDDGNACTDDGPCDPISGCLNTPRSCDDDNLRTVDTCDEETGCANTPAVTCDPGYGCNPGTGACERVLSCGVGRGGSPGSPSNTGQYSFGSYPTRSQCQAACNANPICECIVYSDTSTICSLHTKTCPAIRTPGTALLYFDKGCSL